MHSRSIGNILLEYTLLTPQQLEEALAFHRDKDMRLGEAIIQLSFLKQEDILRALSLQLGLDYLEELNPDEIPNDLIQAVPINFAKKNELIPIKREEGHVVVALVDPENHTALDDLRILFEAPIKPVIVGSNIIVDAINSCYNRTPENDAVMSELDEDGTDMIDDFEEVEDLLDSDDEAPIIRLVNQLLVRAVKQQASDIHVEPFEKELVVRYRIDGSLYEIMRPPKKVQNSILSRIKIMADLNIAEKRLPQDGRIRIKLAGKDIDIRVSTLPTSYGESCVMRLLDRSKVLQDLSSLGFFKKDLVVIRELISRSHGILLVTGPTGSGKTTTLYACLAEINEPDVKIITVEDPVEYQIPGINQCQVNAKIDMTFGAALRSILRQDPDVVMIGEIRDKETAEIAVQASLTGHLVISTLHTNDTATTPTRIIDMGVEPFLVGASLIGVIAQRLIRRVCKSCRIPQDLTEKQLLEIGLNPKVVEGKTIYKASGCTECLETGYGGRTAIHEVLTISDGVRDLIIANSDAISIKRQAMKENMRTLRESAIIKMLNGETSFEEVMMLTQEDVKREQKN
ncbi:MAG: type II secretion system ATPase GspE [bacterium]|nr:type II secretion system ATPase GspE [bacterium]MBU1917001.1 type II secretion system ATPase GspE [bacterium]